MLEFYKLPPDDVLRRRKYLKDDAEEPMEVSEFKKLVDELLALRIRCARLEADLKWATNQYSFLARFLDISVEEVPGATPLTREVHASVRISDELLARKERPKVVANVMELLVRKLAVELATGQAEPEIHVGKQPLPPPTPADAARWRSFLQAANEKGTK